jgi:fructose 1,6-bisphosphatase
MNSPQEEKCSQTTAPLAQGTQEMTNIGMISVQRSRTQTQEYILGAKIVPFDMFAKKSLALVNKSKAVVTPGFRRQTEFEPCTCQDQQFTYTAVT